jgi:hypothetical protein
LCHSYTAERYKVNFDFLPWQAEAADMLERGKLDLILHIDDGLLPSHFSSEGFGEAKFLEILFQSRP